MILSEESSEKYYTLVKLSRFPKLARLTRLFKITRMMKVLRNQRRYTSFISFGARIQPAIGRLSLSLVLTFIIIHIVSCIWGVAGEFNEGDSDNWIMRLGYLDKSPLELYITSFYWTIQTTFSVGYGDIPAVTITEKFHSIAFSPLNLIYFGSRLVACVWMFAGVFVYSFLIGSFTSLFTNLDISREKIRKNLNFLQKIKRDYLLKGPIYSKVRSFIRYGGEKSVEDYKEFLKELPGDLSIEVSYRIYQKELEKIEYFSVLLSNLASFLSIRINPTHSLPFSEVS